MDDNERTFLLSREQLVELLSRPRIARRFLKRKQRLIIEMDAREFRHLIRRMGNWKMSIGVPPFFLHFRERPPGTLHAVLSPLSKKVYIHADAYNPHAGLRHLVNHLIHDVEPWRPAKTAVRLTKDVGSIPVSALKRLLKKRLNGRGSKHES